MDAKEHEWFFDGIKKFTVMQSYCETMAAGLQSLSAKLVNYDNQIKSLETRVKARELALAEIEKNIRERRVHVEAGSDAVRGALNAKHLDLIKREQGIELKERQIEETQKKANSLLLAAEGKAAKKMAVAA